MHRALILQRKLLIQRKQNGGKLDLATVTRASNLAATTDLRGEDVYPWVRRVIGRAKGRDEEMLRLLDRWQRSGAQRLDADGDNVYDHSAAVALMDHLWPQLVTVEFRPALGKKLFDQIESSVLPLNDFEDWGWSTHVQKDLRAVLGRKVRGRYSRIYCGGPARHPKTRKARRELRARCRGRLLAALRTAAGETGSKYGSEDPAKWIVQATCEETSPPSCDQIVPTTAGAIATPPFPWQNRGTYHQVVGLTGHR